MTDKKLDYIKTVERLDAQCSLLSEQLDALNLAFDTKHKEYLEAKKKVLMLDPEIAKEDAMWKEFMRIHGTPNNMQRKKED
tara:strand:- start:824 stop:1066 length:243 start_codon:yes stop_codon:yes gene_type:complete